MFQQIDNRFKISLLKDKLPFMLTKCIRESCICVSSVNLTPGPTCKLLCERELLLGGRLLGWHGALQQSFKTQRTNYNQEFVYLACRKVHLITEQTSILNVMLVCYCDACLFGFFCHRSKQMREISISVWNLISANTINGTQAGFMSL